MYSKYVSYIVCTQTHTIPRTKKSSHNFVVYWEKKYQLRPGYSQLYRTSGLYDYMNHAVGSLKELLESRSGYSRISRFAGYLAHNITLYTVQGRTMNHAAGSLEELVENLVKTWEMEATHKTDFEQVFPHFLDNGFVDFECRILKVNKESKIMCIDKSFDFTKSSIIINLHRPVIFLIACIWYLN